MVDSIREWLISGEIPVEQCLPSVMCCIQAECPFPNKCHSVSFVGQCGVVYFLLYKCFIQFDDDGEHWKAMVER